MDLATRQILTLAAHGHTTSEIAERTGLIPEAVRVSLCHAMTILGARSKLEAVILGLQAHLISLPDTTLPGGRDGQ